MRAWTPQTAPPVSIAIVRRSPIVRVVQIIVPPASAEAGGTIGPSFSFGFPLTRERFSAHHLFEQGGDIGADRKSTRLNSSHITISYAVFCLKKKKRQFC